METKERLIVSLLWAFVAVWLMFNIIRTATGVYQYNIKYGNHWELADRASTLTQKTEYIDKFVTALEEGNLRGGFNGIFFHTPSNDFDNNIIALKSLQLRMREIQNMNVSSFEYQLAIQQITQQEMTEANAMLGVFSGTWWKENRPLFWMWIAIINWGLWVVLIGFAIFYSIEYSY